jgi:hypothetical protein
MIFTLDEDLEIGSWLDLGIFIGSAHRSPRAAGGLDTCPQAAFADFHAVIRERARLPAERDHHLRHGAWATPIPPRREPPRHRARAAGEFATFDGFPGERLMLNIPKRCCWWTWRRATACRACPSGFPPTRRCGCAIRLTDLGVPVVEVASFAHPKVVPNMKDAEEVFARIKRKPGVVYRGQAPNVRGAHRAIEAKVGEMLGLITVSETYTHHNQNMTNDEAIEQNIQSFRLAERSRHPVRDGARHGVLVPLRGLIPRRP